MTYLPLPDVIDPANRRCVTILIPDDDGHKEAFWGHFYNLTKWYTWERDDTEKGKAVAAVWHGVWLDAFQRFVAEECGDMSSFDMRLQGCSLEYTLNGTDWITIADLNASDCPDLQGPTGATGPQGPQGEPGQDGADAGQPGEQAGGTDEIDYGGCKEIVLTVPANGATVVPFRVLPEYTVYLEDITGAWTKDATNPLQAWYCPTGNQFVLGACNPSYPDPETGILATQPLHRLVCRYGSSYFDAQGASGYEIPAGSESSLTLLMNDSDRSNNAGSATVLVRVCNEIPLWCHEFNFMAGSDEGWTPWSSIPTQGAVAGIGWTALPAGSAGSDYAYFYSPLFPATLNDLIVEVHLTNALSGSLCRFDLKLNTTSYSGADSGHCGLTLRTWSGLDGVDRIFLGIEEGGASDVWNGVEKVVLRGPGTNPWGTDNCT